MPIHITSPVVGVPVDTEGTLNLVTDSSERYGTRSKPPETSVSLTCSPDQKLGLTAGLLREKPLGQSVRLHEDWLQKHRYVKSPTGHKHLVDGDCRSMAAVALLSQNRVLGLLKAENKFRGGFAERDFMPFGAEDGYILEELAIAASSLLERVLPIEHTGN